MTATALRVVPEPLRVLPGGRTGRPKLAEIHRMELQALGAEEREMSRVLRPIVRRVAVRARADSSEQFRDVAAIAHYLERHRQRWDPEPAA